MHLTNHISQVINDFPNPPICKWVTKVGFVMGSPESIKRYKK